MSETGQSILCAVLMALGGFVGFVQGCQSGIDSTRNAAIEAKAAEWTIDPKTGVREFRFIGPNTKEAGK